jgi:hypothetical protein
MPYLNIDDGMDEHPKVDALSDAAFRLYVSGKLYCARKLTDGFVPHAKARRLTVTGNDATAAELVRAGLWHDLGEGCDNPACIEERTCHRDGRAGHYIVHDYLQWNHSKHWWDSRRKEDAERKKKWRAERRAGGVTPDVRPDVHADVRPESRQESRRQSVHQSQTRNQTPDTRTNPLVLAPPVDGWGSVTDLQNAREGRAKADGFEGESA